jgi:hypothetical protein
MNKIEAVPRLRQSEARYDARRRSEASLIGHPSTRGILWHYQTVYYNQRSGIGARGQSRESNLEVGKARGSEIKSHKVTEEYSDLMQVYQAFKRH